MRVCLIAYDFPPLNSGGSHRPLRFCRYLEENGIEPVVFTLSSYDEGARIDEGLCDKLPPNLEIHRSQMREPSFLESPAFGRYFQLSDSLGRRWEPGLKASLERAWSREPWEAVVVTAPPFSLLRLGAWAAKRFGVPLVSDMRDGWSLWCITPYASWLHYALTRFWEGHWLTRSDAVLVPTLGVLDDMKSQHARLDQRLHYIPNGFDGDISDDVRPLEVLPKDSLTIGYAGSFYFNPYSHKLLHSAWYTKKPYQYLQYVPRLEDWSYRSPLYFLKAIKELFNLDIRWRGKIKLRIAGTQPPAIHRMVEDMEMQDTVDFVGFLAKEDLPSFYEDCDYALSTSIKLENGRDYCIAGKTYECVELGVPMLGFVCEGSQKDFLASSGLAVLFDPDQAKMNAHRLQELIRKGRKFEPNIEFLRQFNPSETTKKLTDVLQGIRRA